MGDLLLSSAKPEVECSTLVGKPQVLHIHSDFFAENLYNLLSSGTNVTLHNKVAPDAEYLIWKL